MTKKNITLAVFLFFIISIVNAQDARFGWANNIGINRTFATSNDIKNSSITTDIYGNLYVTGYFENTVDFDLSIDTFNLTSTGNADGFIAKYDARGDFVWAKKIGGKGADYIDAANTDNIGDIVIVGRFNSDSILFLNKNQTFSLKSDQNQEMFIVKLDKDGEVKWANCTKGNSVFNNLNVKIDKSQKIIVCGNFNGKTDFDPSIFTYYLTSKGGFDIFVLKLNTNGDFEMAQSIGNKNDENNTSMTIDNNNAIILLGTYSDTVDFDPGMSIFQLYAYYGKSYNGYILKLDSNGSFDWAKSYEVYYNNCIASDANNNIYCTGSFANKSLDVFIMKFNSSGSFLWVKSISNEIYNEIGKSIIIDDSGYIYSTGEFSDTVDFDPGVDTFLLGERNYLSSGWGDIYINKFDSSGNFKWAKSIAATNRDFADEIVLDRYRNIFISGTFYAKFEADPGLDSFFIYPINKNHYDIFLVKLLQCENSKSSINETTCNFYISPSGKYWDTSGIYSDTISNSTGCDSIITINLTILHSTTDTVHKAICYSYISPSGKYNWNSTGIYIDTLVNAVGCDSLIIINLTILDSSKNNITNTICNKYTSPSAKYTWINSGTYYDTIPNQAGCDSIIEIKLSILKTTYSNISKRVCENYISPSGKILTSSNIYYDTIPNQAGCDSIIQIKLEVLKHTSSIINVVACASYISPSGKIWISNGTYYDTIPNEAGCDSFMTIYLKIHNSFSSILVSSCYSYTSPSGKYIWNTSGTYYDTISNQSGCDSFITIKLNVLESAKSYVSISACNKFISPSGKYTWYYSGVYFDTIPNQAGCDSIIVLDLNIRNSSSIINETACKSYTSPSGKYTWTKSGMYVDTIQNKSGCDSVIGINLIIKNADISVSQSGYILTANATSSSYQWFDCNQNFAIISGETSQQFIAQNNGDFAVSITQNNCTDTSICFSVTSAGINKNPNFKYQIYPNPSKGIITIEVSEISNIKIYDGIGKLVYNAENIAKTSQHDLSKLSSGIYYIQLSNNKGIVTENIVIEK